MALLAGIPRTLLAILVLAMLMALPAPAHSQAPQGRQLTADVVALDHVIVLNRRGASMPNGMIFALKRDVVPTTCYDKNQDCTLGKIPPTLVPGKVMLRRNKRARPIVLRMNVGDTLTINFWNLLNPTAVDAMQPATRSASLHVMGLEWTRHSLDDGSLVGANPTSVIPPSASATQYVLRATAEGSFLLFSTAADVGGFLNGGGTDNGQPMTGLFGAVNVQPAGARYYRSQVTHNELALARTGRTADGHPILNYEAVYGPGAGLRAGQPVLNMVDRNGNLVYSDLTAIIRGPFTPVPPLNYAEPQRQQSYREFTIHYHEVVDAIQAFPDYYSYTKPADSAFFSNTINAGNDNFAINYGTGGIGSEILANRFGVGPEGGCPDCKFEEFFLSGWAAGDPAQLVDVPANSPCTTGQLEPAFIANVNNTSLPTAPCTVQKGTLTNGVMRPLTKARQAFYPDDPSNVYHSYINDHVVFRILHAGALATHVHHQHAHQWLKTNDDDNSTYLDSQMITMGASYTLDMAYNGSGNRNKTVGDSIFHCHFYPHFASGMWSLWRSHDVFEEGSIIIPPSAHVIVPWNRMLPDGEIGKGTPIPAIVPFPDLPMAPIPARVKVVPVSDPKTKATIGYTAEVNAVDLAKGMNPGFPFFIPGIAGRRAPHPPLDFAVDSGQELNGGLPRHVLVQGTITQAQTPLDFSKDLTTANALQLPEQGTFVEKVAMNFHSRCFQNSFFPDGRSGSFRTNGLPPAPGAPFADPALDPAFENENRESICTNNRAQPLPSNRIRRYKAAAFQTDLVFNKQGYHFPQSRILSLWSDVRPTLGSPGQVPRPPQPFFFRANSGEAVEYWHTNLIPDYYLLDDFQVRTPTDIVGQHIHLVKFDVTSSDGAGNGYNYEDGTFSPNEVQARLGAINKCRGMINANPNARNPFALFPACSDAATSRTIRQPLPPPPAICAGTASPGIAATPCPAAWNGAQTTVQRWFADPLLNNNKIDRTIRTVFTHDHFGPSTHQQTGLYSALLVEPTGSTWFDNETGVPMATRPDGGPTSWQAVIQSPGPAVNTYREFALAVQDSQLAYTASSVPSARTTSYSPVNPTWASPGNSINSPTSQGCPSGMSPPCPAIISSGGGTGMETVNYRNEPFVFRLNPLASNTPPVPIVNDLSFVFASLNGRGNGTSAQPVPGMPIGSAGFPFPPAITQGLFGPDPYTALLRAYAGDNVQVRVIAGAHAVPHTFGINGVKWLFEPGTPADPAAVNNSGYRDTEAIGISEHFEMLFPLPRTPANPGQVFTDYLYLADANTGQPGLSDGMWGLLRAYQAPQTNLMRLPTNAQPAPLPPPSGPAGYSCPPGKAIDKTFRITAIPAVQALPNGTITLNSRTTPGGPITSAQSVNKTTVNAGLLYVMTDDLVNGKLTSGIVEPLMLRVNAGDCVQIDLTNGIDLSNAQTSAIFTNLSMTQFDLSAPPSTRVGLHAQMLAYDALQSAGRNIGFNPTLTADPGKKVTYFWYAGNLQFNPNGSAAVTQPVELGGLNLLPSDTIQQSTQGLVAAMVVEPPNTSWCLDSTTSRASAYIYPGTVNCANVGAATPVYHEFIAVHQDDFNNSFGTSDAVNYRTEPLLFRFGQTSGDSSWLFQNDITCKTGNGLVNGDPQTPVFKARATEPVRLRMLHPGGNGNEQVMTVYGHLWQEEPYQAGTTLIGSNPSSNSQGSRDEHGPNDHFEVLIKAGGDKGGIGDHLIRTYPSADFQGGLWSTLRVCAQLPCPPPPQSTCPPSTLAPRVTTPAPRAATAPLVRRFSRVLHTGGTAVDHGRAVPRSPQPPPQPQPEEPPKPPQPPPQ